MTGIKWTSFNILIIIVQKLHKFMCFHMNKKGCGPFHFCNYSGCENQRGSYSTTYTMFTISQLTYSIKAPHLHMLCYSFWAELLLYFPKHWLWWTADYSRWNFAHPELHHPRDSTDLAASLTHLLSSSGKEPPPEPEFSLKVPFLPNMDNTFAG